MQWWASGPIVFCREGHLESNRTRLMIAEKRAGCAVRVITHDEPIPGYLAELNPDQIYPFLVTKDLACYGHALEELLHERYPAPPLLPYEPIRRAQMRQLAEQVRSWYGLSPFELRGKFHYLAKGFDPHLTFYASSEISVLDIAITALLFDMPRIQYRFARGSAFAGYAKMMLMRTASAVLSQPQTRRAAIDAPWDSFEGAA